MDAKKVNMIDGMNLEELKTFFESEHRRQEDMEKYVLRIKEQELVDELNLMKIKKEKISKDKNEMEKQLGDLLAQFNKKKDIELKARFEKEEIQKLLRGIEKSKLTALESDKQRELERLAAERESIRLKE